MCSSEGMKRTTCGGELAAHWSTQGGIAMETPVISLPELFGSRNPEDWDPRARIVSANSRPWPVSESYPGELSNGSSLAEYVSRYELRQDGRLASSGLKMSVDSEGAVG